MFDEYLDFLQEGYLFSDKTISIDLDKFESGESNKLIVVGLSGAGKSTLGTYLSKKYKCGFNELDICSRKVMTDDEHIAYKYNMQIASNSFLFKKFYDKCFKPALLSNKKEILEGAIFQSYYLVPSTRTLVNKYPVIILGKSALRAAWDRTKRSLNREKYKNANTQIKIKKLKIGMDLNFNYLQKYVDGFKKERIKHGGNIQVFKIPKLIGVVRK